MNPSTSTLLADFFTPSVIATVGMGIFGAFTSVQLYFLRTLNTRFEILGSAIREVTAVTQNWLKDHEEKDTDRHIANLHRFEKISVALAKLGSDNGSHFYKET